MIIAVPKETAPGERRVALVPQAVGKLVQRGLEVVVEAGAGSAAGFADQDYADQGARIEADGGAVYGQADIVLRVQISSVEDADRIREGGAAIALLFPLSNSEVVRRLAERRVTSFAMDLMPRITRAQSMDVLSSMSSIAGYKAVLLAAGLLPKYFPMLMTAAGTITPARVLVLGAGVAGLQAIATAKRLGAVVEAFDVRPVVKEQVESLGGRFVELDVDTSSAQDKGGYAKEQDEETQRRIRDLLTKHVGKSDVVITTALVPGKRAPVLVTKDMLRGMRAGSIVVDLAAEQGGNCEGCEAGERVVVEGVVIAGPSNLPSEMAVHASELYSRNISTFLAHLVPEAELVLDLEDELTRDPLVTRDGEIVHEKSKEVARATASGDEGG